MALIYFLWCNQMHTTRVMRNVHRYKGVLLLFKHAIYLSIIIQSKHNTLHHVLRFSLISITLSNVKQYSIPISKNLEVI